MSPLVLRIHTSSNFRYYLLVCSSVSIFFVIFCEWCLVITGMLGVACYILVFYILLLSVPPHCFPDFLNAFVSQKNPTHPSISLFGGLVDEGVAWGAYSVLPQCLVGVGTGGVCAPWWWLDLGDRGWVNVVWWWSGRVRGGVGKVWVS